MGDDITVRQFSKNDLLAIAGLQDRWLATIFANKKTYSAEEVKVKFQIRPSLLIYRCRVGDRTYSLMATDDTMAKRFLDAQYTSWKDLTEVMVAERRVPHSRRTIATDDIAAARKEWGRQGTTARWKQKGQEHGNQ